MFNINILWSSSADDIEHLNALFMYDAFYEMEWIINLIELTFFYHWKIGNEKKNR